MNYDIPHFWQTRWGSGQRRQPHRAVCTAGHAGRGRAIGGRGRGRAIGGRGGGGAGQATSQTLHFKCGRPQVARSKLPPGGVSLLVSSCPQVTESVVCHADLARPEAGLQRAERSQEGGGGPAASPLGLWLGASDRQCRRHDLRVQVPLPTHARRPRHWVPKNLAPKGSSIHKGDALLNLTRWINLQRGQSGGSCGS